MPPSIPPGQPSLRGGQGTYASNPCLMRLNTTAWLATHPAHLVLTGAVFLAGVVTLFHILPLGLVLMFASVSALFQTLREVKKKYLMGDVCPAIVLSAQQNLIAVYTNLAASARKPFPAIKILRQPLQRLPKPAYDGMRLATVALYSGHISWQYWRNFSPEAVACIVTDAEENARVLNSIPQSDWQALDEWLAGIPEAKPGLYKLWEMNFATAGEAEPTAPAKPWFKTIPAIIAFSVVGAIFGLVLLAYVIGTIGLHRMRQAPANPTPPRYYAPTAPGTPPPGVTVTAPAHAVNPTNAPMHTPPPETPTQVGAFAVGTAVQANWAGGWIPGTITKINYGGHSMMVKLNNARFPYPIVLSTNQLRLK